MQTRFRFRVLSAFGALVTALLLVVPSLGAQQGGTITGRVVQTSTGQPVAAVQVFISALDLGGLTQQNGRYLLQNVPAGTHTLSVSRIGYRTVEAQITIGAGQTVVQDFSVAEEALQLDAIIVTGTVGGTTRRSIGNSVTVLDAAAITAQVPITSMQQMLSARTPGLNFTRNDGVIGSGSSINIRGFSSILIGNQPLIYVDGIRVDNSFGLGPDNGAAVFFGRDAQGSGGTALDDINPEDIESIEIIKGPAAATLYGTEASAGVIQIITKKGVVGAPEFTFTARGGQNFMQNPAGHLGPQFGCRAGRNRFGTASGASRRGVQCPESELIKFNIYDYHAGKITANNPSVIANDPRGPRDIFSSGLSQAYNLSVNGGTETVRYYISGDWSDATGIVDYNTQTRFNLRTNIDIIFSDAISVNFRGAYQEGETQYAQQHIVQGGAWTELIFAQANHLINHPLNDTTKLCPAETDPSSPDFGVQLQCNPAHAPLQSVQDDADGFYERDPVHFEGVIAKRDYSRFTTSITATQTVGDWFNQRFIVGLDNSWTENSTLIPRSIGDPRFPFRFTSDGRVTLSEPISTNFSLDYSASGIYEPNSTFQFVTSVGIQYNLRKSSTFSASGDGLPSPLFTNLSNLLTYTDPSHRVVEDKSLGFYIQEQVGINGRIFITGAVRADDHSAFGDNFKRKYYPKLSGTWTLSEESFWNFDLINSLRIRTAWGQAGRQPNAFARTPQYDVAVGPDGSPAIRLDTPGNIDVGPETSQEWEGGIDFALLDDRIFGEFTYFKQWIDDVIVRTDLLPSEGFTGNVQANLGAMENWGWEAALDLRIVDTDAFGFNLRFSGDHTMNRITFLDPDADTNPNFREGWFFPNIVTILMDSAKFDDPDPDNVYLASNGNSQWCDFGDPLSPEGLGIGGPSVPCTIVDAQRQELMVGPSFPTYTWSIAPTFRFLRNQLEVFVLAEGQYGRWLANVDLDARGADSGRRAQTNARQAWLFTDATWLGAQIARDERWTGRFDASFWKLREIGARYQIPQSVLGSLGIDRASISFSANNMWTMWQRQWRDRSGVRIPDPETVAQLSSQPNFSIQGMPSLASYAFSLRVSF